MNKEISMILEDWWYNAGHSDYSEIMYKHFEGNNQYSVKVRWNTGKVSDWIHPPKELDHKVVSGHEFLFKAHRCVGG